MKSLEFLKSILATTLAIVLALLLSVRPAQAGYIVTLQQVGPNVVATGSGVINLTGLTFFQAGSQNPLIRPDGSGAAIFTGPTSSNVDIYFEPNGPMSFGSNPFVLSARSGDMVGIAAGFEGTVLTVPTGYVSGTALSDMAVYSGRTLASLGVTPGTYVWTWGTGANQNFKLEILPAILPATNITNISSRASVQTGSHVPIAGFMVLDQATLDESVECRLRDRKVGRCGTELERAGCGGFDIES